MTVYATSTAPAYATSTSAEPETILPGPHPGRDTVATALMVLSAAAENIARIDVQRLRELMSEYGTPVPDQVETMVEAAADFRGQLLGKVSGPQAQLDRIHAWLLVNAPEALTPGSPVAEVVTDMLARATRPPTAPAVVESTVVQRGQRPQRGGKGGRRELTALPSASRPQPVSQNP